jgi:phage terminase large subunit-like protein
MLMFGLRLGSDPRVVVTTTPKPIKIIRELLADPTTAIARGSTYENRANLAPAFMAQIIRKYEGTRLGRQELNAEILDDVPGALWNRALIEQTRCPSTNPFPI